MGLESAIEDQTERYDGFYRRHRRLHDLLRFDVRYRVRRLHEVLAALRWPTCKRRVLDVGFGYGDLLESFPADCSIVGADISTSAVAAAKLDPRFARFTEAEFVAIPEDGASALPTGPFDLALSSHTLEHVPDDRAVLRSLRTRLAPGGLVAIFVPIEEPDYNLFHLRHYSLQSITERVRQAGFRILHVEGSMYVNGHLWKILTVPSRRRWPVVRYVADALRLCVLSLFPYPLLRLLDGLLFRLGFGARQALVVAERVNAGR